MITNAVAAFVIILSVVWSAGWWAQRLSRLKLEGEARTGPAAAREIEQLSTENIGLKKKVEQLEQRLAVLERIATDPAERTAREIEQLR
jgi:cell division protein FtsB